ncbi:hypothetical protein LXL04_000634 [Taraxacum kok-saghyz]
MVSSWWEVRWLQLGLTLFREELISSCGDVCEIGFRLDLIYQNVEWISDIGCPHCHSGGETLAHLMFSCVLAREVWAKVARWRGFVWPTSSSIKEWLTWVNMQRISAGKRGRVEIIIITTCWVLWRFRNAVVFDVGYLRDAPATVLFGEWFRFGKPSNQQFLFERTSLKHGILSKQIKEDGPSIMNRGDFVSEFDSEFVSETASIAMNLGAVVVVATKAHFNSKINLVPVPIQLIGEEKIITKMFFTKKTISLGMAKIPITDGYPIPESELTGESADAKITELIDLLNPSVDALMLRTL